MVLAFPPAHRRLRLTVSKICLVPHSPVLPSKNGIERTTNQTNERTNDHTLDHPTPGLAWDALLHPKSPLRRPSPTYPPPMLVVDVSGSSIPPSVLFVKWK